MEEYPVTGEAQGLRAPAAGRWARLGARLRQARGDAVARRARRVILLVMMLWIVNAFDLAFTLLAQRCGNFHEFNPIAARLLHTPAGLVAFKVLMVAFASCVFLAFRRRGLTEICCWGLSAAYGGLSGVWWTYYLVRGTWQWF